MYNLPLQGNTDLTWYNKEFELRGVQRFLRPIIREVDL